MPLTGKTPLSVVILTKNEAARITDCLCSVDWADETLIVDDESSDQTVQIAESLGARVLRRRMDMEGRHRNWAYAQAKHEWVLSLDADERITPELASEIQQLLADSPASDIYSIPRRNYIGNRWIRHGGWYPSAQVKLFKKSRFQWEETTVHPRAISKSEKPWGALRQDMIHFSYRDLADFTGKLNRQTTLETRKWLQDGRRIGITIMLWRTIDRFYRSWRGKQGYQDGFAGYVVAVYAGMYQFLSYAKYWHQKQNRGPHPKRRPVSRSRRVPAGPTAEKKTTLSAVILTKNAAATIQNCLDSVRWIGQVIVIDGGSTDGTVEACQAAGAQVVHLEIQDDFGQLRNAGTDRATGDWVLQLDADEVVTPEFRDELEWILSHSVPHAAYKFRRMNNFLGHWMRFGGWDHFSLHLFQRGRARYEGRVHEKLLVDGSIGTLQTGVEHYPFRSIEEFMDRQNRYTSLEARQWVESQGPVPLETIRQHAVWRPLKLFWKIMVKKQGFRNGMVGFLFAGLYAFVYFLKWSKIWELQDASETG